MGVISVLMLSSSAAEPSSWASIVAQPEPDSPATSLTPGNKTITQSVDDPGPSPIDEDLQFGGSCTQSGLPTNAETGVFYVLSVSRCNVGDNWTIHGLWPSHESRDLSPEFCCDNNSCPVGKAQLDSTELSELSDIEYSPGTMLKQRLDKSWSSCKAMPNAKFWEYEWKKHGTCTCFETPAQYFKFALKEYDRLGFPSEIGIAYGPSKCKTAKECKIDMRRVPPPTNGLVLDAIDQNGVDDSSSLGEVPLIEDNALFPSLPTNDSTEVNTTGGANPQCENMKRGPKCNPGDSCKNYEGCKRCAKSGYCTNQP